jgi:PAS domain S-box-containing protein
MTPMDTALTGSYNHLIVVLSAGIAVLASYTVLDLAERVTAAHGMVRRAWLISGAAAMGIGIWSMHYTALLAFHLPVAVWYHWPTVLLSFLAAIASSLVALYVVSLKRLGIPAAVAGSVLQGAGIAALHYIAMAAMRLPAMCHYSPAIVALSLFLAMAGSCLCLWLTFLFRQEPSGGKLRKAAGAVLMGTAITAMHYSGMAAVSFTASAAVPDLSHAVEVTSLGIAGIVAVAVMVLLGAVVTVLVDRLQERNALLDALFEQAPQAIALLTPDLQVIRLNQEFTRIFGYTPPEAAGRRLRDLIAPGEFDLQSLRLLTSLKNGQRADAETIRRRKDGSRLPVLAVGVPMVVPGWQTRLICAMYTDITERKAAEVALQSLSSRLLEVQEMERRHLARELHDEIGQILTYLRLLLRMNGDSPAETLPRRLEPARGIIDDLLARVRSLSFDLRPPDLDQLGLLPALLALLERYSVQTGILVDFKHQGVNRRFASEVETGAYRVVQEALTNVARHAGVAGVTVRAWIDGNMLNLQIEDRGCGFDLHAALKSPRSNGLYGLQERAQLLGGKLVIESTPGSGTTIAAELPIDKTSAA